MKFILLHFSLFSMTFYAKTFHFIPSVFIGIFMFNTFSSVFHLHLFCICSISAIHTKQQKLYTKVLNEIQHSPQQRKNREETRIAARTTLCRCKSLALNRKEISTDFLLCTFFLFPSFSLILALLFAGRKYVKLNKNVQKMK